MWQSAGVLRPEWNVPFVQTFKDIASGFGKYWQENSSELIFDIILTWNEFLVSVVTVNIAVVLLTLSARLSLWCFSILTQPQGHITTWLYNEETFLLRTPVKYSVFRWTHAMKHLCAQVVFGFGWNCWHFWIVLVNQDKKMRMKFSKEVTGWHS